MITRFEKFREPDLRRIGSAVFCIKDFYLKINKKSLAHSKGTEIQFYKDKYYTIKMCYGDAQGAIEKYGLDYMPVECINRIVILDENSIRFEFEVNIDNKFPKFSNNVEYPKFFEYFTIPAFTSDSNNYNL